MEEIHISDDEIHEIEKLLLPSGCHFAEDALRVIKYWSSSDVSACPGSGKTTVLLAKIKLLADRMPFDDGAGICVLSHTNVAVNEIRDKLSLYSDKFNNYPNYIGTIQSFIDRFITMPYVRKTVGHSVQPVDGRTYAQHMWTIILKRKSRYFSVANCLENKYKTLRTVYKDIVDYIATIHTNQYGDLYDGRSKSAIAGFSTPSAKQFLELKGRLLKDEGLMLFEESVFFANGAVKSLSEKYTDLFSKRFRYVFIDEYQDCTETQREALDKIFDSAKCSVFRIGDPDQAIYNSHNDTYKDWYPNNSCLSIASTCRYPQEIADVLSPLKNGGDAISSLLGSGAYKPALIIFDQNTIESVIGKFVSILQDYGLCSNDGTYKAIGAIRNINASGITIGSYWKGFDGSKQMRGRLNYWLIIDDICENLSKGKLYQVEPLVRKIICRMFHYCGIKVNGSSKEYTLSSIHNKLNENYREGYSHYILCLTQLDVVDRENVHSVIYNMFNNLFSATLLNGKNIYDCVPAYFLEEPTVEKKYTENNNVFVDTTCGINIVFNTIHGVKGETHDATLYLETELRGSSDIVRVLNRYGVGKAGDSNLYDYSRKLVYVGMSRPRKLLCLAIRGSTYEKSGNAFCDWDKYDIRIKGVSNV